MTSSSPIDAGVLQAIEAAIAERGFSGRLRGGEAYFHCMQHDDTNASAR